jgi:hypothetical protein
MRQIFILCVLAMLLVFVGCTPASNDELPNIEPEVCGIQECHGLEVTCGSEVPEFCTEIYQLGDFCRQFAHCETVEGTCTFAPDPEFRACSACVANCATLEGEEAFSCESACRTQFE